MKRFPLAALALLGSVGLSAPAAAVTSLVTVDLQDTVLYDDCFEISVPITVTGSAPAVRYEAALTLHDPEGFRDDPFFADAPSVGNEPTTISGSVPTGGATSAKTLRPEVCGFEPSGLWRADLKVEFFDSNDALTETATATDTANFRQATTYTSLKRGRLSRAFVIRTTIEGPTGIERCRHCLVKLQEKSGRRWDTILQGETNRRGVFRTGVKPKEGVVYRAVTPQTWISRSLSRTFQLP
jgi:hypothetical protein